MVKLNKLIISDSQYDDIAKGIAFGSGIGILIGLLFNNILFMFSLGSVIGIIISLIYSTTKKNNYKK